MCLCGNVLRPIESVRLSTCVPVWLRVYVPAWRRAYVPESLRG